MQNWELARIYGEDFIHEAVQAPHNHGMPAASALTAVTESHLIYSI